MGSHSDQSIRILLISIVELLRPSFLYGDGLVWGIAVDMARMNLSNLINKV